MSTFLNTFNAQPHQKHIQELRSRINIYSYLHVTFKWLRIIKQHLKCAAQQIQQYKISSANERNKRTYIIKTYTNRDILMATTLEGPPKQHNPLDISKLFEPQPYPSSINYLTPPPSEKDFLWIHTPYLAPQIDLVHERESSRDASSDIEWISSMDLIPHLHNDRLTVHLNRLNTSFLLRSSASLLPWNATNPTSPILYSSVCMTFPTGYSKALTCQMWKM